MPKMRFRPKSVLWLFIGPALLLLFAGLAWAQEDTAPKHALRSPSAVTGTIGGEGHDSYTIRAHKGQVLAVRISWQRAGEDHAEFSVSESPDFYDSSSATFGKQSDTGRRWSGRVPKDSSYYIYVVVHPEAHYLLQVTLR
jgi:hypothetical protein